MEADLHAFACISIPAIACMPKKVGSATKRGMNTNWADRLRTAIEEDGRSKRAISLAAGLGPNYIEQTFNRGSSPVQGKLAAVLDALGQEAAIYVYTGVRANAQTIEFLNRLASAPEELRRSALDLLQQLARKYPPPEDAA